MLEASAASGFRPLLQSLIDEVPGVLGVAFCDEEGEAVDLCGAENVDEYDLKVMAASWSLSMDLLRRSVEEKGAGSTALVSVVCGRYTYVVAPVGSTYFLAVWAESDVSLGKGLSAARRLVSILRAEV